VGKQKLKRWEEEEGRISSEAVFISGKGSKHMSLLTFHWPFHFNFLCGFLLAFHHPFLPAFPQQEVNINYRKSACEPIFTSLKIIYVGQVEDNRKPRIQFKQN